jgi:2-amino-4-hydroxy-6-hydroxymethyldihydropteridine diphosphokinase
MDAGDLYLGLGSNIGEPLAQMRRAFHELLRRKIIAPPILKSSLYKTPPWGAVADQPDFLNAVLRCRPSLPPLELLESLKAIERDMGRRPNAPRGGPRPIDIDILLYGIEIIDLPDLTVPHPRLRERAFVLLPLYEVACYLTDPATGFPFADSLHRLNEERRCIERLPIQL